MPLKDDVRERFVAVVDTDERQDVLLSFVENVYAQLGETLNHYLAPSRELSLALTHLEQSFDAAVNGILRRRF